MYKYQLKKISKALSWVLRHGIIKLKLEIDSNGYVSLDDIFTLNNFNECTIDHITQIIENDSKQRFTMIRQNNKYYIRANQGHSKDIGNLIDDKTLLSLLPKDQLRKYSKAYHGTDTKSWKLIQNDGLKPMSRKHCHLAKSFDNKQVISGMRNNCAVILEIDLVKAFDSGIQFYESDNGVILTSNMIPISMITRIK